MKLLGIDFGTKRVGMAISDEEGRMAFPHEVWANDETLVKKVTNLCELEEIGMIVVGESHNYRGEPNQVMMAVNEFMAKLKESVTANLVLEPEYLTSAQAERLQGKNDKLDASAAAIILQSYIDRTNPTPITNVNE